MPKEDVMTSKLDEIQARAEAVEARKLTYVGIKVQLSQCEEDRSKLLAAFRAVEAVHVREDAEQFYNDIDGGSRSTLVYYCGTCVDGDEVPYSWPCPTIRAIRGALG